ncbi:MAG: oxidoreductase [Calditrichaeota bacterium]|nr:oxidoreductase [Calditrichota bacterium]RQW04021.1 MAG: oxidoreductase [Calditrichota bacterium]
MDHVNTHTACLAGATGLTGNHCLNYLLKDPAYSEIVVLTRRALSVKHQKIREEIIDFNKLEEYRKVIRGDHIFCCLGTTIRKAGNRQAFRKVDFDYPKNIADITRANGATQYLLISAIGADPDSRIFYNRTKGETETAVSSVSFPSLIIFRPSLLLGDRQEFRLGEKTGEILLRILSPLLMGKWRKYRPVQAKAVAESMVEMAKVELKGIHIFESDEIRFFHRRLQNPRTR